MRVAEESRQRSQGRVQVSAGVPLQLGPRVILCQVWSWHNIMQAGRTACPFISGFRLSPPLCGSGVISSQVRHLLFWRGSFSQEGDSYKKLALILIAAEQWMPWPGKETQWHQQYQTLSPLLLSATQILFLIFSLFYRGTASPRFWLVPISGQFMGRVKVWGEQQFPLLLLAPSW